ncbi:hypothetical protein E7Z59_02165 [Robertkochia marina]|uniref:Cellobiose phosphorylase n=2 Tax=Robertkochia marina TaxID=1227945 RepID=A0A4S3M4P1_9FLAO|nr:hypothetical protein [Robertkochia marina]THD69157.1 hypothetical protein E7Z59_02165 [Robertkochia marina]TRZ47585.1 hypothetical protein D3A96_02435 [Robertkochia marina]
MKNMQQIHLGNTPASLAKTDIDFEETVVDGETFYKITNVDQMRSFFMTIVSNSNHWMFIASNGGLTAGRKNSNYALFPYYTDDKITEMAEITGSKSIFRVSVKGKVYLWEPFSVRQFGVYNLSRNLYKNALGNKVIFEEVNHDLDMTFRYEWNSSTTFGFIKRSSLLNTGEQAAEVDLIDGIQNLLPWGVEDALQNASSNLVDAYKKCELQAQAGIGIYSLSAVIVDKAEPSEALRANVVWSQGLQGSKRLLSSLQLDAFRRGEEVNEETDVRAEKGAYFLNSSITLGAGDAREWMIIADVNKSVPDIISLKEQILGANNIQEEILGDIAAGSEELKALVGAADGLQLTADKRRVTRHFANTMFNIMRGGIFDSNYQIEKSDFMPYLRKANKSLYQKHEELLNKLPPIFTLADLNRLVGETDDMDLKRLCKEYLPLKFSRRHGDPSRPWNKFSINTRNEIDGSKILDYQGNWRDIFQNWEALAHAYPEFIEGMIHKFLNATTFDGYNPYRVTKDGFDWETIEPDNPWSYIGYWGDHQIIYLLKFLEFIEEYYPERLAAYFDQNIFVYANVPYRIKDYGSILKDPKNTIDFDFAADKEIRATRNELGADGALIRDRKGETHRVNFTEKILATVLAKLSNFIPEGGIWMNTQRPEWNDANNALVGNGVSMVTLYYLRRFLNYLESLIENSPGGDPEISVELHTFFEHIRSAFDQHKGLLSGAISDQDRRMVLDLLGEAGSHYRKTIYEHGFSGERRSLSLKEVQEFAALAKTWMEHTVRANKRSDGLYHAYNLVTIKGEQEAEISYLSEMLEGQVAVLSSGYLSVEESLNVLDALRKSALYREDQNSYILYPNKELPKFLDRNNIPESGVNKSKLLQRLLAEGNQQVISADIHGGVHFNGNFHNINSLEEALDQLPEEYSTLVSQERDLLGAIFEEVFNHKAFTGRSGTFYGYEGLGSIYWHMVSKLLLAVWEIADRAKREGADKEVLDRVIAHYFEINEGIGANKSPEVYGAFPTDPYSHTPGGKGAQQPGMTGQVKEDVLSRFGELGVAVQEGSLTFKPYMLKEEEFLAKPARFEYVDIQGNFRTIELDKDTLAFTCCQVPVIYTRADKNEVQIYLRSGEVETLGGNALDTEYSSMVFGRTGDIIKVVVAIN